ncbi:DUF2207 domain-containing protein [Candidatus Nomurabacteria bacterium]|nr:DUF2207 domain-containing protein [Candidatus Nomurabacteria bacterium]
MRKVISTILLSVAFWLALFSFSYAEEITSFASDIVINSDSSFTVTETIEYDFGSANKHGIYRNIKNQHAQPATAWYKKRYIDLTLKYVKKDGAFEPYSLEEYDGLKIKIGSPDHLITGKHVYEVQYEVGGALAVYPDTTEIYWNVTGDEWQVPIKNATARVSFLSEGRFDKTHYCYVGMPGSNTLCDEIEPSDSKTIFRTQLINSGEGFTIAQSLKIPFEPVVLEKYNLVLLVVFVMLTWYLLLGLWIYRWRIKYRQSKTVIPQYEPYQDFKPMFTGVLIDNRLDSKDITAGIIHLAQQGYISIKQVTSELPWLLKKVFKFNDFEITLLNISEPKLSTHKELLKILFVYPDQVGDKVRLSEIKKDYSRLQSNYNIIKELKKTVNSDLVELGFLSKLELIRPTPIKIIYYVVIVLLLIFGSVIFFKEYSIVVVVLVCFAVSPIFTFAAERRTQKGYEALYYLKGFKEFLSVTEKERYKFHNAPALSPQQFMEYLPYAIAFGVEEEWAEVFKDIQIDFPDWYESNETVSFSAKSFNSNLSSFSTAFSASTGTGGSGSSVGGSSGGGSGGGGGGSW